MDDYRNLFNKSIAPLPHLSNEVLEETFMNSSRRGLKKRLNVGNPSV